MSTVAAIAPRSAQELAAALREGGPVRLRGAATKLGWGRPLAELPLLSTARLDAIVEHNVGDLTAVLEAGVPLAAAQARFAATGQMLALDPPGADATIGGVVASGDAGPLRHRYGAPRDLVLGVEVALPDGSVARAGSKVIKNVAGYDLAKLMAGAFGTLGAITRLNVRLHPLPRAPLTVVARGDDADALLAAAGALARLGLEAEALDLRWRDGAGAVLARLAGPAAPARGEAALAAALATAPALAGELVGDDEALWSAQREGQRGAIVVRVATTQRGLRAVLAAARARGAAVVARAAVATAWLALPADHGDADAIARLRAELAPAPCVLLDAPAPLRAAVDPWGELGARELALMRAVKARFDPDGRCNPGLFVGGI